MDAPLISVVMPVRNVPAIYLDQAVRSVLAQSEPRFEFVIVDDRSAAENVAELRAWARRDARIRVVAARSPGVAGALNTGLAQARGTFIARMDGDDVTLPDRFAVQVAYLQSHPDCVCVGCDVLLIDPEGAALARVWQETDHRAIEARLLLGVGGSICHPSILMRRAAVEQVGRYDERFDCSQDLDLFLRLAEVGKLANLTSVQLHYRQHLASVNTRMHSRQWQYKRIITDRARARRGLTPLSLPRRPPPNSIGITYSRWGRMALRAGNTYTGWKYTARALLRAPFEAPTWLRVVAGYMQRKYGVHSLEREALPAPRLGLVDNQHADAALRSVRKAA